jgi:hypothetical protein
MITKIKNIQNVTSELTFSNYIDHFIARIGITRNKHLIRPGLYKIGNPSSDSDIFITANYTLSFDALRKSLHGIDGYILVLDTKGINVWCAAGKGTFGTDELVNKIKEFELEKIVDHRNIILPQLGGPGVAAHEVKNETGFRVKYGPVLAKDLPEYLKNNKATPEMRRVNFLLRDRLILIPVEIVGMLLPLLLIGGILYFTLGLFPSLAFSSSILAGVVLFPILLPWLPTPNFSTKGFILGGIVALVFGAFNVVFNNYSSMVLLILTTLVILLVIPSVTAFLSLNFTGATTFTSRSGVKKEIYTFFPKMIWMFAGGILFFIGSILYKTLI